MVTKTITSLQHPLSKAWTRLRTSKESREETQTVLICGRKMVQELKPPIVITDAPCEIVCKEHYLVTPAVLKKITGLENPDGYAGIMPLPKASIVNNPKYVLILDQIMDPGNLGTLLRTALALRWEMVIMTPNTVDLFNDKALRAARGASFHLPFAILKTEEIEHCMQKNKWHTFTADLEGDLLENVPFTPPLALILSSESKGATPWSEKHAQKITIPMDPSVESLNVAVSGAIMLYTMRNA